MPEQSNAQRGIGGKTMLYGEAFVFLFLGFTILVAQYGQRKNGWQ